MTASRLQKEQKMAPIRRERLWADGRSPNKVVPTLPQNTFVESPPTSAINHEAENQLHPDGPQGEPNRRTREE